MAKNQANSNQIKDKAILSRHIGVQEIDGTHLKDGAVGSDQLALASVTEDHLNVDWSAKASEILKTKLVIDYVQAQAVTVSATSGTVNVSTLITAPLATVDEPLGVVVDPAKNFVIIRTETDVTEPIRDTDGEEVKGRLTHDGTDFVINFFTNKAGIEVPFEFSVDTSIVFQYPKRFDFYSVSEMFGVNEKFVDYGVDASTRYDITQLVADIFGGTYVLNGDGVGVNADTLLSQVVTNADAIDAILETVAEMQEYAEETRALVEAKAQENADAIAAIAIAQRFDKVIEEADLTGDATTFAIVAPVDKEPAPGNYDVYLNGMLQMVGVHYTEASYIDGRVESIDFAPDALVAGDVVQVRWFA